MRQCDVRCFGADLLLLLCLSFGNGRLTRPAYITCCCLTLTLVKHLAAHVWLPVVAWQRYQVTAGAICTVYCHTIRTGKGNYG